MASMTLVEFSALKVRMNNAKTTAMPMCTRRRNRSSVGRRQRSTQKLVVSAVSAESALLKEAATMPTVKKTTTGSPKRPVAANMGNSSSSCVAAVVPRVAPETRAVRRGRETANWPERKPCHSCTYLSVPHATSCT